MGGGGGMKGPKGGVAQDGGRAGCWQLFRILTPVPGLHGPNLGHGRALRLVPAKSEEPHRSGNTLPALTVCYSCVALTL